MHGAAKAAFFVHFNSRFLKGFLAIDAKATFHVKLFFEGFFTSFP